MALSKIGHFPIKSTISGHTGILDINFPLALSVSELFDLFQQELNISTCAAASRLSRRMSEP